MKYLERLYKILEEGKIPRWKYGFYTGDSNWPFGDSGAAYQIEYQPERKKWIALIHELGRADFYVQGEYDTSREACIKFLEMSDVTLHLASHIPEFAA